MSFLEDLGRAVGLGGSRPASTSLGLHSARRFRVLVERERARVHRCDDQFSLLAFAVADLRSGWPTLVKTAKILRRRLRITDDAGWLNRGTIGVLLPGTPGWGAWTMADDVCASLPLGIPLPECRVSSYPSDWLPGRSGKEDRGERARLRARRKLPAGLAEMLLVQAMPPWKRALDIAGAGLGLLLLWPLLLVVAAAVKLTSPGPVLFAQLRSGRGGKPFLMYKFRTMTTDAEARKALLLAQRAGRAGLQDQGRSPRHAAGPLVAGRQHRRAATVVERAPRRYVAGRAAAVALRGSRGLLRLAPPAPGRNSRADLHLASAGTLARDLRRVDADGHPLCPLAVVAAGPEVVAANDSRTDFPPWLVAAVRNDDLRK